MTGEIVTMTRADLNLLQEVNANLKLVLSALGERPVQTYSAPEIPPSELARLRKKHGPQVLRDFNAKQGAGR